MSLKWLVSMKSTSKLFMCWSTHIFSFNFKILHRKRKIHLNADVLSRDHTVQDEPSEEDVSENKIHKLFEHNICQIKDCQICVKRLGPRTGSFGPLNVMNPIKVQLLKKLPFSKIKALSRISEGFSITFTNEQPRRGPTVSLERWQGGLKMSS